MGRGSSALAPDAVAMPPHIVLMCSVSGYIMHPLGRYGLEVLKIPDYCICGIVEYEMKYL